MAHITSVVAVARCISSTPTPTATATATTEATVGAVAAAIAIGPTAKMMIYRRKPRMPTEGACRCRREAMAIACTL